jgi:YHS domain-containing protein
MKMLVCIASLMLALAVFMPARLSADPTTQPTAINKLCPVTHDPVDPKIPTIEYKGKTIGFCCSDCIKAFNADPEKYMANLK